MEVDAYKMTTPSDERSLRRELEKRLGRSVNCWYWRLLVLDGYVGDAEKKRERGDEDHLDEMVERVADLEREVWQVDDQQADEPEKSRPKRQALKESHLDPRPQDSYPAALSVLVAEHVASTEDAVREYRQKHLPRDLPDGFFRHEVDALEWLRKREFETGLPTLPLEKSAHIRSQHPVQYETPEPDLKRFDYLQGDDDALSQLSDLSRRLAARWPWREGQATRFILTGRIPLIPRCHFDLTSANGVPPAPWPAIRPMDLTGAWRIRIEIDPMMSPEDLAEEYRKFRKKLSHKHGGARPKGVSEKSASLALRSGFWPEEMSWVEKMDDWNKYCDSQAASKGTTKHQDWKYEPNRNGNFRRDVGTARRQILFPGYLLSEDEVKKMIESWEESNRLSGYATEGD